MYRGRGETRKKRGRRRWNSEASGGRQRFQKNDATEKKLKKSTGVSSWPFKRKKGGEGEKGGRKGEDRPCVLGPRSHMSERSIMRGLTPGPKKRRFEGQVKKKRKKERRKPRKP